jgi:hypothetical protein
VRRFQIGSDGVDDGIRIFAAGSFEGLVVSFHGSVMMVE